MLSIVRPFDGSPKLSPPPIPAIPVSPPTPVTMETTVLRRAPAPGDRGGPDRVRPGGSSLYVVHPTNKNKTDRSKE